MDLLFLQHSTAHLCCSADANTAAGTASLKLSALTQLIMQIVGDAISDLVFVEAILTDLKMTLSQWNDQYTDLPNVLCKVSVSWWISWIELWNCRLNPQQTSRVIIIEDEIYNLHLFHVFVMKSVERVEQLMFFWLIIC